MKKQEKRQEIRISWQKTFQFAKIAAGTDHKPNIDGILVDYSLAGIRFITNEPLDKNTPLLITLDLAGLGNNAADWRTLWETGSADQLNVIGSVMWCLVSDHKFGKYEVGTRFTKRAS